MSSCCWTYRATKRINIDSWKRPSKGIILSCCRMSYRVISQIYQTGWSILEEEGTLWIIWAAQPPPAHQLSSSKHHWKWFSMFKSFFILFLFLREREGKSTGNGRESGAYFFCIPLASIWLSLPPVYTLTHQGNMQRAKILIYTSSSSSLTCIADVLTQGVKKR